ncbi:MAG: sigma-70 family RNA polymerase sigma factor [Myxococcales bacterium]|nr:sigma-70 family RNA polymerase sigma factor [Myxococcales bacterium]
MLSFAATLTAVEATEATAGRRPLTDGQRNRLRALFVSHADLVWRLLRRHGLTQEQSDDGLQEVFSVALRRLNALEAGKERSFLCSTAVVVARRVGQMKESLPGTLPDVESPLSLDEQSDAHRKRRLVIELLGQLEEPLRMVLVLQDVEGLSKREAAEVLDIPEGTVASRTKKARAQFRALLEAHVGRLE